MRFCEDQPMSFAIYIPARNVEATIVSVLERIPEEIRNGAVEIIIVDNGSTDATKEVVEEYQSRNPKLSINYIQNLKDAGYGGSQKIAYNRVINKGYQSVIMIHGDGQYAPECADLLLRKLLTSEAGLVFGSRMTGKPLEGGMPFYRFFFNTLLTRVSNLLLGTKLSEFHSGYRAYKAEALRELQIENFTSDFHFDTEIIVQLVEKGFQVAEVTIPTHYGKDSQSISFSRSIWYGLNVLKTVTWYRVKKIKLRE